MIPIDRLLAAFSALRSAGVRSVYVSQLADRVDVTVNCEAPEQVRSLAASMCAPPPVWHYEDERRTLDTSVTYCDGTRLWLSCVLVADAKEQAA